MIGEAADVTSAVMAALTAEGYRVRLTLPDAADDIQAAYGIVNLLGLQPAFRFAGLEDQEAPLSAAAQTFQIVKQFASGLQARGDDGWFVNVTALDGHFGLGRTSMSSVAASGTLGVVKTLRRECPRLRVKNIDVEPNMPADMLAARLLQELTGDEDLVEVGLTREGRWRPALRKEPIPCDRPPLPLDQQSVVLVTGGARGITAEIARRLAVEAKPRLVLVGRSPLSAVSANLDACTAAGATVEYHALDVRDREAFAKLIDDLYERFGRIDGVIHGAGVIADQRLGAKTLSSFTAVFRTKVDGAWTLARKLRMDNLKFLAFFGSISGRLGNAGQVDYSAANETLNKLADYLNQRWPGRVVCLNWGPWEGGMVSEKLRRLYAQAGIELVPIEEGVAAFLAEICQKDRRSAEVVLARGVQRLSMGIAA